VRTAALDALRVLPAATIAPLVASLQHDSNDAVRKAASPDPRAGRTRHDVAEVLALAVAGELQDPLSLRDALGRAGDRLALPEVLDIVERVREREAAEPAGRRPEWAAARAAAHLVLAKRGSRLGLYDLRESLERSARPLPMDVLTALALVGDAACLESIASAHARTTDTWWRTHLGDAFRAILKREKLTHRHAAVKKILKRWPKMVSTL
jgi:hypothetical protein